MTDSGNTGRNGELLVAEFLRRSGYTVVKRNYRSRFGEIDIIAENSEYIIFTEVKTRSANSLFTPAEAVNAAKRRRRLLTAEDFLAKYETSLQPRFDVAEVIVSGGGGDRYKLNYIKNAF